MRKNVTRKDHRSSLLLNLCFLQSGELRFRKGRTEKGRVPRLHNNVVAKAVSTSMLLSTSPCPGDGFSHHFCHLCSYLRWQCCFPKRVRFRNWPVFVPHDLNVSTYTGFCPEGDLPLEGPALSSRREIICLLSRKTSLWGSLFSSWISEMQVFRSEGKLNAVIPKKQEPRRGCISDEYPLCCYPDDYILVMFLREP